MPLGITHHTRRWTCCAQNWHCWIVAGQTALHGTMPSSHLWIWSFLTSHSFNCLLPAFTCGQFSECNQFNGKCNCPAGFGGDDCLQPVCGALADGDDRPMRQGDYCECKEGWTGINCNVCTENKACNALMPTNDGGVCYQNGEVVHENYQQCDVTNKKIVQILDGKKPQVTFNCNKNDTTCDFQCRFSRKVMRP